MKKEMTKAKFLGLVIIAGILMWYFCPWLSGLMGGGEPTPEPETPPAVLKPNVDES